MYVGPFVNAMLEDDIVFAINAMDSSMEMQINLLEDEGLRRTYIHTYIHTCFCRLLLCTCAHTGLLFQQPIADKNDPQCGNRSNHSQHAVNLLENRR